MPTLRHVKCKSIANTKTNVAQPVTARQMSMIKRKKKENKYFKSKKVKISQLANVSMSTGELMNVMGKIVRKETLIFAFSITFYIPDKPIYNTRFQNSPSPRIPRFARRISPCSIPIPIPIPVPSHPTPSRKNRQKLSFASMLLLCQHSHYVSANSKPLLYLFRVYDILYFTFLIIFFVR
ncbi:hypothetical protein P5V15_003218 [Pogonomyrmex californicus]